MTKLESFFSALLYTLFLFPLLLLFSKLFYIQSVNYSELFWAVKNTLMQSLGSAFIVAFFGFVFSLGLLAIQNPKVGRLLELLCVLPSFIPTLFILNFSLDWVEPFPIGVLGIMIVHSIIYTGLMANYFKKSILQELEGYLKLAYLEGARFWQVFWALFPLIRNIFLRGFVFVFIVCLSSFSVPLVVGGGAGTTLEVLIYEKVKISADWSAALMLSLVQIVLVFTVVQASQKFKGFHKDFSLKNHSVRIFSSKKILYFLLGLVALFYSVFVIDFIFGWQQLLKIAGLDQKIISLIPNSFLIGLLGAIVFLFIYLIQSYLSVRSKVHGFLISFVFGSSALSGLAYFLFFHERLLFLGFILCLVTLFYPSILNFSGWSLLQSLSWQSDVAEIMGASRGLIFRKIIFPQVIKRGCFLAALCGFWCLGDFAISKIIFAQEISLAMLTESLMSSYRIQAAYAVSSVVLLLGIFLFVLLGALGHVLDKKSL